MTIHGSNRVRSPLRLLLVLALLGAACGGGDPTGTTTSATTEPTAGPRGESPVAGDQTDEPPPRDDAPAAGETDEPPRRNLVAWILDLAPSAPTGPTGFDLYRHLQRRECGAIPARVEALSDPARTLYEGAAQACLAAFDGREALWPRAEQAHRRVEGRRGELNCLDVVVLGVLADLLEAHRSNPDGRFVAATDPSAAHAPPCPLLDGITPEWGPPGTTVTIAGSHLDRVDRVEVHGSDTGNGDLPLERSDSGIRVTIPEDLEPGPVCLLLVVTEPDDWRVDGAIFHVTEPATEEPTETQGPACPPAA